ncbi:nucleoside monophosphate kinase [Streptomyces sp. NPDC058961]|uniref:nucleoside monophosphate kinase n=1 Tax=Streptomyces sp. NPDC058961 TaxID=3346680 RepID=UPI0036A56123
MSTTSAPVVAVVGPPGAGKSTLSGALADMWAVSVFRVREAAHSAAQRDPVIAAALESTRDPLGWLPDLLAHHLVREALDASPNRAVLEGFPGNEYQARTLALYLRSLGRELSVIELTARPGTLAGRVARRRVCPSCDTCPGGPRRPATASTTQPGLCSVCGTPLIVRDTDRGERAETRRARYSASLPGIRAALTQEGVSWQTLATDPDQPPASTRLLSLMPFERTSS